MVGSGGPRMAADIGGEVDASDELTYKGELGVVPSDGTMVLTKQVLGIVGLGEQREEIGGRGGMATDDLLHHGFHLHDDALVGLAPHIGDDALREVGLAQMSHIDEGHASSTEAEKEEVTCQFQLPLLFEESPTAFLATTSEQGGMDVEGLQMTDVLVADGSFDGVRHATIGAQKGMAIVGKALAHCLVIDRLQGAEIAGGGVFAKSSGLQPSLVVGNELA